MLRSHIFACFIFVTTSASLHAGETAQDAAWRRQLQFLESRQTRDPLDYHAPASLGYAYMKRARITGDMTYFSKAEECFNTSLKIEKGNLEATLALAEVYSAQHRFADSIELVSKVLTATPADPAALGVKGDAQLNIGDVAGAERAYADLKKVEDGFYYLSREANLKYAKGDTNGAIEVLTDALDVVPSSMPTDLAWCQVLLGQLYFTTGHFARADEFYKAALEALPEYTAALDHQAELLAALEKYDDAAKIYKQLIDRNPRPDLQQALGDVYLYQGKKDDAQKWYGLALAGYMKSVDAGNLHYAHHLAGFFCDAQENPVEALKWAKKDLELRHNSYAYDSLAWALYKNADFPNAAKAMTQALSSGIKDAHIYFHASLIYARADEFQKGTASMRQAMAIDPMFQKFHAHR